MEKKDKKIETPKYRHPLFQLTNRVLIFFSLFVVISLLFYITGSMNHFLDTSLLFILRILQIASTITVLFSVFSFIQIIIFSIFYKDLFYLWHLFYVIFSSVISIIGFVFSGVINVLATGI